MHSQTPFIQIHAPQHLAIEGKRAFNDRLPLRSHTETKTTWNKGVSIQIAGRQKTDLYSTGYSQAVTHPSTNPAQCCLISVIRREPVHSAWYGRRTLQCTHRHLLYRYTLHSIWPFGGKRTFNDRLPLRSHTETKTTYTWNKGVSIQIAGRQKKTYSTGYSQAVTHPSTNPAQCCLTSVIRQEPVHSAWYGCRTLQCTHRHLLYRYTLHTQHLAIRREKNF